MKTKIAILIVLGFLFSSGSLRCENDAAELYKKLKDKYGKIQSISLKFQSRNSELIGSIKAQKGNKYLLDYSSRLIFCDGKSVWNYDKKENKCIITDYDEDASGSLSIEKFFFDFLDKYHPATLTEETSSKGTKLFVLKLQQSDEHSTNSGALKLWVDPKSLVIRSIDLHESNGQNIIDINELQTSQKTTGKKLEINLPEKVTIIDLR